MRREAIVLSSIILTGSLVACGEDQTEPAAVETVDSAASSTTQSESGRQADTLFTQATLRTINEDSILFLGDMDPEILHGKLIDCGDPYKGELTVHYPDVEAQELREIDLALPYEDGYDPVSTKCGVIRDAGGLKLLVEARYARAAKGIDGSGTELAYFVVDPQSGEIVFESDPVMGEDVHDAVGETYYIRDSVYFVNPVDSMRGQRMVSTKAVDYYVVQKTKLDEIQVEDVFGDFLREDESTEEWATGFVRLGDEFFELVYQQDAEGFRYIAVNVQSGEQTILTDETYEGLEDDNRTGTPYDVYTWVVSDGVLVGSSQHVNFPTLTFAPGKGVSLIDGAFPQGVEDAGDFKGQWLNATVLDGVLSQHSDSLGIIVSDVETGEQLFVRSQKDLQGTNIDQASADKNSLYLHAGFEFYRVDMATGEQSSMSGAALPVATVDLNPRLLDQGSATLYITKLMGEEEKTATVNVVGF